MHLHPQSNRQVRLAVHVVNRGAVEHPVVALIPVQLAERGGDIPRTYLVARAVGYELPYVGADVPPSQGVQVPVRLDRRNLAVVALEVVVGCADQAGWDDITEQDRQDAILFGIGAVLIEGDENERVVHEVLVPKQGPKECPRVQAPATAMFVSWASDVMLGVMNIHWGRVLAARSEQNKVIFFIFASRSVPRATLL